MRTIYVADDGTEFDDEISCMDYEWTLNHPLNNICFYDEDDNVLTNIFSEDTYEKTERIVVLNKASLRSLHELAKYTGFCCYEDINECGEWVFNQIKCGFVKV